jgi:tetratricopeptide (TPR) repeat protein
MKVPYPDAQFCSVLRALGLGAGLLVTSSCQIGRESARMEEPPKATAEGLAKESAPALVGFKAKPRKPQDAGPWELKWQQLQSAPDSVTLADHWRVCGLKFRFRNYSELFRCLDLIEARVARLGEDTPEHRYAPILIGWMRSAADAELGQTDEALKWAELAWATLPSAYHEVTGVVFECHDTTTFVTGIPCSLLQKNDFAAVALEAGGSKWGPEVRGQRASRSSQANVTNFPGRNNPAGLDLRPQAIAMSLAAQRSVLHATRGDMVRARAALADLQRWADARAGWKGGFYFTNQAWELAIGPLYVMGDYGGAVATYERVAKLRTRPAAPWLSQPVTSLFASAHDARLFAEGLDDASTAFMYASSLARIGASDRAAQALDTMLAAADLRDMGSIYWATLYERSTIALARGQRAEGITQLQQAADAIEEVRHTINFEAGKLGFATTKQSVYAALVRALAESGDWGGAFTAAERAKSRALVDLLAQIHDLAPPPEADTKVRELLASAAVDDAQIGFPVNPETAESRGILLTARAELPQLAPEAASLVSVHAVKPADIAQKLAPGETLIDYFQAGDDLYAFVLNGTAVKGFKLDGKGVEDDVRALRGAIESGASAPPLARALYDRLIRPLARDIPGTKLTISPHGSLHYLPFPALFDGERYLIDRYSLRVVPSAGVLAYLKPDAPAKSGKLLALGNPDLGNPAYDLPNAQQEALQVAKLFPDSRALVRQQASKTAIKELGSSFEMLHFASHAKFDPDSPLNSGLYLARGSEADGRLTVRDLYSLRLDARLVTLSACETGVGKVLSGDDVIGLTRGFLYAGARSIVASLWEVDDAATAELMISFYKHLASLGPREALRQAQLEARAKHPAPRLWAAFEITGNAN